MDTLKTAIVVVLLLAVLYGVYVTLNQPDKEIPEEIAWAQDQTTGPLQVDLGSDQRTAAGATASLGDSAPWSSDSTSAAAYETMAGTPENVAGSLPPTPYGQPPQEVAPMNAVAAPDLITSSAGSYGSTGPSGVGQAEGAGAYALSPPPETGQLAETANASSGYGAGNGYDAGNSFPPNQSPDATALQPPPADPNASIYSPSNTTAPAGSYGDPSELSGNSQMIATAEPPVADSHATPAPSPPDAEFSRIGNVVQSAEGQIAQGQYYEALLTLSLAYSAPGMSSEEHLQLQRLLDPLAGKVIYSQEHLIGSPYQIQAGETLQSVAKKHNVPWQLLANINGLRDPAAVQPGATVKVVPGPFHAEVDIADGSLTLFAGRLYAGRFAITVNGNNVPTPGEYQVNDKQPGHSFYAGNAQTVAPEDPQNPFGGVWIDLGGNVSIHGTSNSPGQSERHGCISLAAKDANDLYGILSLGSNVVVR